MSITEAYGLFKASEELFRCPACCGPMAFRNSNSLVCSNNHCFDLSKYGYLNFAPNQNKTKYTKDLFESRRQIFQSGFYNPVKDALERMIHEYPEASSPVRILDAGCGEGFFTSNLTTASIPPRDVFAMDLQKDAVILAARSIHGIKWIVGDLSNIPLQPASIDVLLNIFSPANYGEFLRVLATDGLVLKVIPGNRYLIELRECVKGQLINKEYSNEHVLRCFEKNLVCLDRKRLFYQLPVTGQQLASFVKMTPLMFNVDKAMLRLDGIKCISIDIEIIVGRKSKRDCGNGKR